MSTAIDRIARWLHRMLCERLRAESAGITRRNHCALFVPRQPLKWPVFSRSQGRNCLILERSAGFVMMGSTVRFCESAPITLKYQALGLMPAFSRG